MLWRHQNKSGETRTSSLTNLIRRNIILEGIIAQHIQKGKNYFKKMVSKKLQIITQFVVIIYNKFIFSSRKGLLTYMQYRKIFLKPVLG